MTDIFENKILCNGCNKETTKGYVLKNGYRIRMWKCDMCNKQWPHPLDIEEYKSFNKLRNKRFEVKLRLVGNSYAVSIPREIVDFQEEFNREFNKMLSMCLDEPGKLSIFFRKKIRI